jgi:hypothetical protein
MEGGRGAKMWAEWDAWVEAHPRVSLMVVWAILWAWEKYRARSSKAGVL